MGNGMISSQVVAKAGNLLDQILTTDMAADRLLGQFFRQNRTGQQERAQLGDLVFFSLRHRRILEAWLTQIAVVKPFQGIGLAASAYVSLTHGDAERLRQILNVPTQADKQPDTLPSLSSLTPSERVSLPDWIWAEWADRWGVDQAEQLGSALNQPPTVDLRVNVLKTTRQEVQSVLRTHGILSEPTPFSPHGLRLLKREPLGGISPFQGGLFEIQDEGSQLIAPLLAPRSGSTLVDLCAGGGGKSLHLAVLMGDRGQIMAADTNSRRLDGMKPRIRRAGIRCIRPVAIRHEGDRRLHPWTGNADGVLVDAPCSGSGLFRRNPELKWHLTPDKVEMLHQRQCALLDVGARLTAKTGRLVYATCSLLFRENEAVVASFLQDNKAFHLRPVASLPGLHHLKGLLDGSPFLTLLPHRTQTDGFFAAIFERKS